MCPRFDEFRGQNRIETRVTGLRSSFGDGGTDSPSFYSTGFMLHGHTGGFRLATVVDVAPYNPPVAGSFCGTVFGAGGVSSASTAGSAVTSS